MPESTECSFVQVGWQSPRLVSSSQDVLAVLAVPRPQQRSSNGSASLKTATKICKTATTSSKRHPDISTTSSQRTQSPRKLRVLAQLLQDNKIDNDESSANFVRCQIILFHNGWDQAQKRMKLFHFSSGGSVATLGDKEWSLPL